MRKKQQNEIIEIIDTLRDVQSAKLYADAQEGAIAVGMFIENIEGECPFHQCLREDSTDGSNTSASG